jgi:uncharacterized protein YcnI
MNRLTRFAGLTALALAGLPAVASAHVTLQPNEVPAGEFKRLDVRVPNERDNASTKKVEVKFPPGFIFVSYEPVAGWNAEVKMAKLDKPIEVFGEQHSEQVDTITFTTEGQGVRPGEFQDFGLSVGLPDAAGNTLTFKALQSYSSGEVVRWIGPPDSDEPAPQVKLTGASEQEGASGANGAGQATPTPGTTDSADDDGGSDTLSIIALIVGALGFAVGAAGLLVARRARAAAAT